MTFSIRVTRGSVSSDDNAIRYVGLLPASWMTLYLPTMCPAYCGVIVIDNDNIYRSVVLMTCWALWLVGGLQRAV